MHEQWDKLGPEAIPALIDALHNQRFSYRYLVARKLGAVGDGRAVDALIERLDDGDFILRKDAIYALGELYQRGWISGSRLVDSIAPGLCDAEPSVRRAAQTVLMECRGNRTAEVNPET